MRDLIALLSQNKKIEIPEWIHHLSQGKNKSSPSYGGSSQRRNFSEPRKSFDNYSENSERRFENYSPKKYKY
jgi:hypothetical protein